MKMDLFCLVIKIKIISICIFTVVMADTDASEKLKTSVRETQLSVL